MPTGLTERQHQVLALVARGRTNKEVAKEMHISYGTVKMHLADAYRRLGVRNRAAAIVRAVALGWLDVDGWRKRVEY